MLPADPAQWKLPVLMAFPKVGVMHPIRELTDEEVTKLSDYTAQAMKYRSRFELFKILNRNYEEWWNYIQGLLLPVDGLSEPELLEIDRLLMNYMTAAKSVIDQCRRLYKQEFKGTPEEDDLNNYIAKCEQQSWPFAFYQDLRNFVQHCGLPTGKFSRTANRHSVSLVIGTEASYLLKNYDKWGKSKLDASKGLIDLIDVTQNYQHNLIHDFGGFVAKKFVYKLFDAHNFFASLANEVKQVGENSETHIVDSYSKEGNKFLYHFVIPPSDLLKSFGLTVNQTPTNEPSPQV